MKLTLTHNGKEVKYGEARGDTAVIWINEARYFQEMEGFGIDKSQQNKLSKYKYLYFKVYGQQFREYKVKSQDFFALAWKYPKEGSRFEKSFDSKLVISEKVAGELNEKRVKDDRAEFDEQLKYNY